MNVIRLNIVRVGRKRLHLNRVRIGKPQDGDDAGSDIGTALFAADGTGVFAADKSGVYCE